ncbi:MAG: RNA polymerase factor sigma-54 [Rhodospirillales bacterium]|nr:RNA polymerase factor sigma-54 [Rhodospirillales bacterium]MDE2319756.1 RNA polymerase factor sigma-54 [Rhodospirillales bacterium]
MAFAPSYAPRLDLRQSQSLVMTPQLRQAIQLLQFSNLEASAFIEDELLKNPLLECETGGETATAIETRTEASAKIPDDPASIAAAGMLPDSTTTSLDLDTSNVYDAGTNADGYGAAEFSGDGDDWNPLEALGAERPCLREHLEQQARLAFSGREDLTIARAMIVALDPAGRLGDTPEAMALALGVELSRFEAVRGIMMRFDPVGVFATNLAECLAVQLADQNRLDPAMQALLDNLEMLARREMRALLDICGVDAADLADMVAELKRLDPKPGAKFDSEPLRPLIPDVLMRPAPVAEDGAPDWLLEINPETMPRLLIRRGFHARLAASANKETKSFLSEQLQGANWLVKALESRAQTILRVSAEIVRRQDGFFRHGISHLRPLTLRDIAAEVELHESTVSRVTSNKSIATPRGIFELKFFFTTALAGANGETHSAETVRHRVAQIINAEKPKNILSDDAVAAILQKEGIDIARRTVAKYREALRIPGSAQRRREKMPA